MRDRQKPNYKMNNYDDQDYLGKRPTRPPYKEPEIDTTIDMKIMRMLPKSSYAMQVDPYTEVDNPATPYHVVNGFNRVMGGKYAGVDNLGGGNLIQYNTAIDSKLLEVFDAAIAIIKLNYKYLPIRSDDNRGKEMINQMRNAISEVVSSLSATTFKDQNIFYYAIETDLPMGDAPTSELKDPEGNYYVDGQGNRRQFYTNLEDVIYAMCMYYQITLQNIAMVFNMMNANRTRMKEMIVMSWNREVAALNSYFGLLKKKAFLAIFDSLALNLQGEYMDLEQMRQANTIAMVASRRSESLNDPLLEIGAYFEMPSKFNMFVCGSTAKTQGVSVFDSATAMATNIDGTTYSFLATIKHLCVTLSVADTLQWARNGRFTTTDNQRYNAIKRDVDAIIAIFTNFKSAFTDLRTVLTIMARIGVVNWKLGARLKITRDTSCELTNYLVVNNIYELILGGATNMTYNNVTKRWRTFTLWNLYFGIPEHAAKQGGAFFSFCLKNLIADDASAKDYLPIAFEVGTFGESDSPIGVLNRKGVTALIKPSATIMANIQTLRRLVPLTSQDTLSLNVGTVQNAGTFNNTQKSYLYRLLLQLAGVGCVNSDYALDPDILSVYEYEIEDITNMVISYCRGNGPFKVSEYTENDLGFYGIKTDNK